MNTIVSSAEIVPGETVLEIGPGMGVLTERLLAVGAKVIAVEKDDQLFVMLKEKFGEKIELINADILEIEPPKGEYKLVANIPYNITGAILEKFLSAESQPSQMVLLVQKEVAERIVAKKNKPFDSAQGKESILSISVKAYGTPRYVERVLAGSFVPAPTVDSAIISIEGIPKEFFSNFNEKAFFTLLQAGFQSKRKKLSSNLAKIYPKERVLEAFQELEMDENTRAEDVSIEIWQKLAENLIK